MLWHHILIWDSWQWKHQTNHLTITSNSNWLNQLMTTMWRGPVHPKDTNDLKSETLRPEQPEEPNNRNTKTTETLKQLKHNNKGISHCVYQKRRHLSPSRHHDFELNNSGDDKNRTWWKKLMQLTSIDWSSHSLCYQNPAKQTTCRVTIAL